MSNFELKSPIPIRSEGKTAAAICFGKKKSNLIKHARNVYSSDGGAAAAGAVTVGVN